MSPVPGDARVAAFEALVAEAYRPMLRYLARRTDPATADDVLGDTLLVLWRRFDDVPADARLPWCLGVARGCLANRVRGDRRFRLLTERLADTARGPAGPAGPAGAAGDDPALDDALARLPARDRELLRLWAWEQLAPREIAVVLDITPNAASIRLHRAIGKLRDLLGARKSEAVPGHLMDRQGTEATSD